MTNEEIEQQIVAWGGEPWLINEFAVALGVTWHRMNRITQRLVREGKLFRHPIGGSWYGYSKFAAPRRFEFLTDLMMQVIMAQEI